MKSLKLFSWLALLTGIIYPLFITAISTLAMREKARGSLLFDQNHHTRGSLWIGQKFERKNIFGAALQLHIIIHFLQTAAI